MSAKTLTFKFQTSFWWISTYHCDTPFPNINYSGLVIFIAHAPIIYTFYMLLAQGRLEILERRIERPFFDFFFFLYLNSEIYKCKKN